MALFKVIMFVVAKMSSLITRDPKQVISMASQVWKYLANTIYHGLIYGNEEGARDLHVFTDSSFNDTCHGCTLVFWGEDLLLWKSSKQSAISVSTAESELIEVMEGAGAAEAVRAVMEELLDLRARVTSHTDSSSAVAIVGGDSGSWRARHLRKRAHTLRQTEGGPG